MTSSLVMLSVLYASLAALLLYTLVSARIALILRAGLVVAFTAAYFLTWKTWNDVSGWPVRAEMPERFLFHAATIVEPDEKAGNQGTIFVWATELTDDGPVGVPRAYRVAYLKSLHSQLREAESRMRNGVPQIGTRKRGPEGHINVSGVKKKVEEVQQFELGNLPSPALPEK